MGKEAERTTGPDNAVRFLPSKEVDKSVLSETASQPRSSRRGATMEPIRCLTETDGYDPFAEPGSPERSAEALLARLRALGCEVRTDGKGRPRVTGANGLPDWLKESIREDFPKVLPLVASPAA
jgi:hypothetical protein